MHSGPERETEQGSRVQGQQTGKSHGGSLSPPARTPPPSIHPTTRGSAGCMNPKFREGREPGSRRHRGQVQASHLIGGGVLSHLHKQGQGCSRMEMSEPGCFSSFLPSASICYKVGGPSCFFLLSFPPLAFATKWTLFWTSKYAWSVFLREKIFLVPVLWT